MDWIPIVFVTFKVLVLCIGMFFAVRWHYEQGKKGKAREKGAFVRGAGKAAAVFLLALLAVGGITFVLVRLLAQDLNLG